MYRKIGNHLYIKQGNNFVHCAVIPRKIKTLAKAVAWF